MSTGRLVAEYTMSESNLSKFSARKLLKGKFSSSLSLLNLFPYIISLSKDVLNNDLILSWNLLASEQLVTLVFG